MRNNVDRVSAPQPENQNSPAAAVEAQQSAGAFSFAVPTEFVNLPSKGRLYPEGHALHNVETVEIRHMTAKDEDILTSESLIKKGIVLDRLLQSVMIDKTIDVNDLIVGDKNALLIACRKYGYGSQYDTTITCPSCFEAQEFCFDIDEWKEKELDLEEFNVTQTPSCTFIAETPISKVSVEFKLLTTKDVEIVEKISERNKKLNLPSSAATDFLVATIVSVNGYDDKVSIQNFINSVPAKDSSYLRKLYDAISPNIDSMSTFTCNLCDFSEAVEVPLDASFFWPK